MSQVQQFLSIHREPIEPAELKELAQPERHVFGLYRLYKFFIGRVAALDERIKKLEAAKET